MAKEYTELTGECWSLVTDNKTMFTLPLFEDCGKNSYNKFEINKYIPTTFNNSSKRVNINNKYKTNLPKKDFNANMNYNYKTDFLIQKRVKSDFSYRKEQKRIMFCSSILIFSLKIIMN